MAESRVEWCWKSDLDPFAPSAPATSFHNLVGKQCESKRLAGQLSQMKEKSKAEIDQCCIRLYTMESFLYKLLDHTMRLIGDPNHEQL